MSNTTDLVSQILNRTAYLDSEIREYQRVISFLLDGGVHVTGITGAPFTDSYTSLTSIAKYYRVQLADVLASNSAIKVSTIYSSLPGGTQVIIPAKEQWDEDIFDRIKEAKVLIDSIRLDEVFMDDNKAELNDLTFSDGVYGT